MEEYYKILGLTNKASQEEIKKSYRKLSKQYHPDLNPDDPEAEEKFKKIVEAYEILTGKQKPKQENPFSYQRRFKANPIKLFVQIKMEEAFHGTNKTVNYDINSTCYKCDGEGGFDPVTCNHCGGKGHVQQGPFVFMCNNCGGNGKIHKKICYTCGGNGSVVTNKSVEITIPKGTTDNTIFNHANGGNVVKGAEPGDVFFILKIMTHPVYQLDGLNLKRKLDVPILDILLGVEKEFDTFEGKLRIKIPKLSEINKTFRLKGKGFSDSSTMISGDMYITLNPILPKDLNEGEVNLINQLKNSDNFIL
jgi:molecular chaperone DnaJ